MQKDTDCLKMNAKLGYFRWLQVYRALLRVNYHRLNHSTKTRYLKLCIGHR